MVPNSLLIILFISFCGTWNPLSCSAEDSVSATPTTRKWPKYTEIRRGKQPQNISSPGRMVNSEVEKEDDDDDDKEIPRIVSNGRGGNEPQEPIVDNAERDETKINDDKKPPNVDVIVMSNEKSPGSGGRRYLEYFRQGSKRTNQPKRSTTRAPPKVSFVEEIVDDNKRPDGCNECRFYCKRCRGAEEVTTGGTWGCCNHNCCGGRCSCQKVN